MDELKSITVTNTAFNLYIMIEIPYLVVYLIGFTGINIIYWGV